MAREFIPANGTGISVTTTENADGSETWTITNTEPSSGGTVTSVSAGIGISVTGSPTTTPTVNIATTAVTAGSYGDGTHVATFTVNAEGQLTAAANVAISVTGLPSGTGLVQVNSGVGSATNLDYGLSTAGALTFRDNTIAPIIAQAASSASPAHNFTIAPQASTTGQPGDFIVNVPAPIGGASNGKFRYQVNGSDYAAFGDISTLSYLWMPAATAITTTNWVMTSDSFSLKLQAMGTTGQVMLKNATDYALVASNAGAQFWNSGSTDFAGGSRVIGIAAAATKPTALPAAGALVWCNGTGTSATVGLSHGIAFSEFLGTTGATLGPDTRTTDAPAAPLALHGGSALSTAVTNVSGGAITLSGGNGATGAGSNAAFLAVFGGGTSTGHGSIALSAPTGIGGSQTTGLPWSWTTLSLAVTGGTTTLSSSQYANTMITLTGTLTSGLTVVFPNIPGFWILNGQLLSFGGFSVSIKTSTTTIVVGSSAFLIFVFTDGGGHIWQK